jgi:hypothetical protein
MALLLYAVVVLSAENRRGKQAPPRTRG